MRVQFLPAAADELMEAADIYEREVRGLGHEFMLEVERVIGVLAELPSLGEKLDEIHRRIPLRRFPYALIFRSDGDVIRVVAVAHRRRRPRYWAPRGTIVRSAKLRNGADHPPSTKMSACS